MIVFLGNAGRLPTTASVAEGLMYLAFVLIVGGITTVPMVWTMVWVALLLNGCEIGWGDGLLFCYNASIAAVIAYVLYFIISEIVKYKISSK